MKRITLPPDIERRLIDEARKRGITPESVALESLRDRFAAAPETRGETDEQRARQRFERRIGALDLGRATGAENAEIDAGLAREYARDHGDD